MWINIPCLQEALAESTLDEFRRSKGRRYALQPLLLLCCVAMMSGAETEGEIEAWVRREGGRWLKWLGFRKERGPSAATIARVFRGIDGARMQAALLLWSEQILDALRVTGGETNGRWLEERWDTGCAGEWLAGNELIREGRQLLVGLVEQVREALGPAAEAEGTDALLAGLVLTGYVERSEIPARPMASPNDGPEDGREDGSESDEAWRMDGFVPPPVPQMNWRPA